MGKPSKCECFYCTTHRALHEAHREKDVKALFDIAESLGNRAISAEFDNDYYKAILDGDWPSAVEILTRSLQKANKIKNAASG